MLGIRTRVRMIVSTDRSTKPFVTTEIFFNWSKKTRKLKLLKSTIRFVEQSPNIAQMMFLNQEIENEELEDLSTYPRLQFSKSWNTIWVEEYLFIFRNRTYYFWERAGPHRGNTKTRLFERKHFSSFQRLSSDHILRLTFNTFSVTRFGNLLEFGQLLSLW